MDTSSHIVIHFNPKLYNQLLYKSYLLCGFSRLGYRNVEASNDPRKDADIHVCIGPHYALHHCLGKPTIYIERCMWGDDLDGVGIGWAGSDGGLILPENCDSLRPKPELHPWRHTESNSAIILSDYGPYPDATYKRAQMIFDRVTLRVHPATGKQQPRLAEHLEGHSVVIGFKSTAMIEAVISGYPIVCLDKRCPAWPVASHQLTEITTPDRHLWLNNLSYLQWRGVEIQAGDALDYVLNNHDAAASRTCHA